MTRKRVRAYALTWHLNSSPAFERLLAEPLRGWADVEFLAWDGEGVPPRFDEFKRDTNSPIVFCQIPPPLDALRETDRPISWLPMWDHAYALSPSYWHSLPPNIRVVALSEAVFSRARLAGLDCERYVYFPKPQHKDKDLGSLFYWDRYGLVSTKTLNRICRELRVRTATILQVRDPGIHRPPLEIAKLDVPTKHLITQFMSPEAFEHELARASMVIAPRPREGVGLSFLEAMAYGAAVIATDAPTMNEYIDAGRNGLLLNKRSETNLRIRRVLGGAIPALRAGEISSRQNWTQMRECQPSQIGEAAFSFVEDGRKTWENSWPRLAAYLGAL